MLYISQTQAGLHILKVEKLDAFTRPLFTKLVTYTYVQDVLYFRGIISTPIVQLVHHHHPPAHPHYIMLIQVCTHTLGCALFVFVMSV